MEIETIDVRYSGATDELIFFRPDTHFIQWLVAYANGRVIVDVGCGSGIVLEQILDAGGRGFGIDHAIDNKAHAKRHLERTISGKPMLNILPNRVQECAKMIGDLGTKGLMLFCRPCHSNFVVDALRMRPKGLEALYITLPENLITYNDLGEFRDSATLIDHSGSSADGEVVYSIK